MAAENLEKAGEAMGIKVKVEILYFNYNVGSSNQIEWENGQVQLVFLLGLKNLTWEILR